MNNAIGNFQDEIGEEIKDVGKSVVREIKDYAKIAKKQVAGDGANNKASEDNKDNKGKKDDSYKKTDPVTGKPVPKKAQLDYLTKAAAQLQLAKLKKVREELEKQRLKVSSQQQVASSQPGTGPEIPETQKPKDNAVAQTLKGSKETGEFKGLIGG